MKLIGPHQQSTLNPQLVHVDIFPMTTLDVGDAPDRHPKYSALFLARVYRPKYKGPGRQVCDLVAEMIVIGLC